MSTSVPPLAVLGAGNMAGAVLRGLLAHLNLRLSTVRVTNQSQDHAAAWSVDPRIEARALESDPTANRWAVRDAELVMIGVKPAQVLDLLSEVAADLQPGTLVISLAAGVTCAAMAERLPAGVAVLRTAPNIASRVGLGVTGLASSPGTLSEAQHALAVTVFASIGTVVPVEEDQLHAVAAISGSGPAYFYYLLERFAECATHQGLDPAQADHLVRAMFVGAAELLRVGTDSPAELRRQISSPRGSTERAIDVLAGADLTDLFDRAVAVAVARTREMGAEVSEARP